MALAAPCKVACLILVLLPHSGLAQRRQPNEPNAAAGTAKAAPVPAAAEGVAEKKSLVVSYAYVFSERVLNLRDVKIKSMAAARLADLLWKHDEAFARNLFNAALRLAAPGRGDASSKNQATGRQWSEILSLIERRDPKWAKQLADSVEPAEKEATAAERSKVQFDNGYALLKSDPAKAVNYIERSLSGGLHPFMHSFLISLRLKDENAANALFLRILDQVAAGPSPDADSLLRLGAYVFTSPKIDPSAPAPPDTVILVGVGNLLLPDITADRPRVPARIVQSYLRTAAEVLTREAATPTSHAPGLYAAGYMLLPKFEKYAPQQAFQVRAAMQLLGPRTPKQLQEETAYESLKAPARQDLEQALKEIEEGGKGPYRDGQYLSLVAELWRQSEFAGARQVAAKISDAEARASLDSLISFKEAATIVERGADPGAAEEIARGLTDGVERAILWLGIAREYSRRGDARHASALINESLAAARKVEDARRPFLLLSAASQLAPSDPESAKVILLEAVTQFNAQGAEQLAEVQWEQRVECGLLWRDFPLNVKGVEVGLQQTLRPLLKNDTEGTVTAALGLKDEKQLAAALLAIAAWMAEPTS